MLLGLVQQVNETIDRIDPVKSAPMFAKEWISRRPDIVAQLPPQFKDEKPKEVFCNVMSGGALHVIKRIPAITRVMCEKMQSRNTDAAVRCATATVLPTSYNRVT